MNLTAIDVLVILTVIASAGYAAWKGFISETLTIFDWLAAAFGCLWFGPYLVPMMRGVVSTAWLASLIAYAVVFLIIFIHPFLSGLAPIGSRPSAVTVDSTNGDAGRLTESHENCAGRRRISGRKRPPLVDTISRR